MEDKNTQSLSESTDLLTQTMARSRGRPRRPTAQRSVHELVLNLTQNSEKKCQNLSQNQNKKHKTLKNAFNSSESQSKPTTSVDTDNSATTETVTTGAAHQNMNRWTIGQKVEARDAVGDWYSAKIVQFSDTKVLVHFERWSSRYDQWFDFNSFLIREKSETTDGGSNASDNCLSFANSMTSEPNYRINEEVLAKWNDNKAYPATIVDIFAQQKSVLVLFFDGYRKKVKMSSIEKMPQNFDGIRVPIDSLKKRNEVFQIRADHNDFKCPVLHCNKGFRKQSLLSQHLKHYHKSDDKKTPTETTVATTPSAPPTTPPEAQKPLAPTTTTTATESKSRLKRKYCRKPLPTVAVRKSNRQQQVVPHTQGSGQEVLPMTANTTPMTASASLQPVVKESPTVTPNTTLPFWDARTIAEIHENDDIDELVHCVCDAREESGLMVQCELCLCWQHAMCMHFNSSSEIPETGYFCHSCRFPKHVRKSNRNAFLTNHCIKFSKQPLLPFTSEDLSPKDVEKELLVATHALLSAALDSKEVLTSLNARIDAKNENEIIEKQNEISANLAKIEEKVGLLEREVNRNEWKDESFCENSEIKSEIYLLFKDLKNAKTICELN